MNDADYFDACHDIGEDYLSHHGILGQKWGVRRYQDYDGSLTAAGRSRYGKTRWTNIDGSINEEGKYHFQKFAKKQIKKNNKYYNKHIKKYKKLADSTDDPEMKSKFANMIKDAEKSRDQVNEYISQMNFDDALTYEKKEQEKVLKTIAAVTGAGALSAGMAGGTVAAIRGAAKVGPAIEGLNPSKIMDSTVDFVCNSKIGQVGQDFVETGIRAYSDARAYVFGIMADETMQRLQKSGLGAQAGKTWSTMYNEFGKNLNIDPKAYNEVTSMVNNTINAAAKGASSSSVAPSVSALVNAYNSGALQKDASNAISTLANDVNSNSIALENTLDYLSKKAGSYNMIK